MRLSCAHIGFNLMLLGRLHQFINAIQYLVLTLRPVLSMEERLRNVLAVKALGDLGGRRVAPGREGDAFSAI